MPRPENMPTRSCGCRMPGIQGRLASAMEVGAEEVRLTVVPFPSFTVILIDISVFAVPVADIGLNGVAQGYAGYGTNTGEHFQT